MKIGITGVEGLLGWHFRCFLFGLENIDVVAIDRQTFNDDRLLDSALKGVDVILHFAGMNRGEETEVAEANVAIAERLIEALERSAIQPHVLFSSSTHIYGDSLYGKSKKDAAKRLEDWASQNEDSLFTCLVLPHLFGEHGKPFYNSVVSTFCHLVATGGEPTIDHDGNLELLHCQDASAAILELINNKTSGEVRLKGRPMLVSEMHACLQKVAKCYLQGEIPNIEDPFELRLFNTFRSYIPDVNRQVELKVFADERGDLFEAVRAHQPGQAFMSTTKPDIIRGNHFHLRKFERFLVVKGQARISLRKMFDDKVVSFDVSGEKHSFVDMPTLHTHSIENTGTEELLTLFWTSEIFNPDDTDTFFESVHI